MSPSTAFQPDPEQARVFDHDRGAMLVTGAPGTGKTVLLRERFARLIEGGADPERVVLVVRTKRARREARAALLSRLQLSLPDARILTVHGLAYHVVGARFRELGYERPPDVLTAADQFSRVQDLLAGEEHPNWPVYGRMLALRGFADEVRQFLLRAQEALLSPGEIQARARSAGLAGWPELAAFYRRYLDVLDDQRVVDFAGLVTQAAATAGAGEPLVDHVLVDDYQEATFASEKLVVGLGAESVVVAGDPGSHIFSFQGRTDAPIRRFMSMLRSALHVELRTPHRSDRPAFEARLSPHTSEENAAVARELRRIHTVDRVPWDELAVVVRRQGSHVGELLRAIDDAAVPRSTPEGGLSLLTEPATRPFVLALRWVARPEERDALVEQLLTSELARLSPASARSMVRAARAAGLPAAASLERADAEETPEYEAVASLRELLGEAERVGRRSVLDAFSILWKRSAYSARMVDEAEFSGGRDLDAILAFAGAVARAGDQADASVAAFLESLEAGGEGPGLTAAPDQEGPQTVRILTAHGTAGMEFDTVVVVGTAEGNFPSLSRPEPMFDLAQLDGPIRQADRNRNRLADERRLFRVVSSRARRRVIFMASEPDGDETKESARSRFVGELGVTWVQASNVPTGDPLTVGEAAGMWRRTLADPGRPAPLRLAAFDGLLSLGVRPERWWFQRGWTGTDRALHEEVRVSFSRLDRLENCALQFVLSEELGLEGGAGYHAWVGHLVHRLIEECEKGLIERTEEALAAEADKRWQPDQFPSHAVSEAFRRLVTRTMLPAWMAVYGQTPALARELRFTFEFEGAEVRGYIDRVGPIQTGGTQITDYKTGKAKGAKAEDNLQLGIYFLAVNRAEELAEFRPVKAVELAFLKETRDGNLLRVQLGLNSKAQQEFGETMAGRLSSLIGQVRRLLDTEVYRPNPAAECRFCDFKPLCPLWPEGRELFPIAREAAT
jgi:superfamily I DNA/RNA helicase/RecB family exonuclease